MGRAVFGERSGAAIADAEASGASASKGAVKAPEKTQGAVKAPDKTEGAVKALEKTSPPKAGSGSVAAAASGPSGTTASLESEPPVIIKGHLKATSLTVPLSLSCPSWLKQVVTCASIRPL